MFFHCSRSLVFSFMTLRVFVLGDWCVSSAFRRITGVTRTSADIQTNSHSSERLFCRGKTIGYHGASDFDDEEETIGRISQGIQANH